MTITAFDKPTIRALRIEIDAALKAVADKHGITLQLGNVTLSAQTFTGKLLGEIPGAKANEELTWATHMADAMGIDISAPSTHPRTPGARVTGYSASRRKFPWTVTLADGKVYTYPSEGIRQMFPAKPSTVREVAPPTGL